MAKKKVAKAIKKSVRIVFGVVAAVLLIIAALCIGFAISWIVGGTNTTAAKIVSLILGALALFIAIKIIQKIRDSIVYERERESIQSGSGGSSSRAPRTPREPQANRKPGSESELKRAVLSALPSSGTYLGSWGHGSAYLRSIGADIWVSPRKISISASIEYKVEHVDYYSQSAIQSAAQDHLNSQASDFAERVKDAVEDYIYNHSGFDGDWSIAANNVTAQFSS